MTAHAEAVAELMTQRTEEFTQLPPYPKPAVTMQQERLTAALFIEVLPLLREHWKEVAHYEDIPLDVDQVAYLNAAQSGRVRCFTVREEQTRQRPDSLMGASFERYMALVGYALYFVRPSLHYKGSVQAAQDVIYLDPSVRGGTGYRFIAFCDDELRKEGVQLVGHHIKARADLNFGPLLARQGYELVDEIWCKRLDR